jgi:hypothetical protein
MTLRTHTNDYQFGRGELSVAILSATGVPEGRRFIGNSPGFTLSVASEKIQHFSSTSGVAKKDLEVTKSVDFAGQIVCDDISAENLALVFAGAVETVTQTSTPVTNERIGANASTNIQAIRSDREYQIGKSSSNPTGVRKISAVTVSSYEGDNAVAWAGTTAKALGAVVKPTSANNHWYMCTTAGTTAGSEPTWPTNGSTVTDGTVVWRDMGLITYTVTTDYKLDTDLGILYIVPTGAIATYLPYVPSGVETSLNVDYTPTAGSRTRVKSGSGGQVKAELWYKADNGAGTNRDLLISSCTLSPEGEIPFITSGDEFSQFTLNVGVNEKDSNTALIYIDGRQL